MTQEWSVITTQPYTYLDPASRVINGYRVTFLITAYNEYHFVDVPTMDKTVTDPKIQEIVNQRKALAGK